MTPTLLMFLAFSQIAVSDFPPQVRWNFVQSAEQDAPVPLCDAEGKCLCPNGYAMVSKQSDVTPNAFVITCESQSSAIGTRRAYDGEYSVVPRPSTFGQ